MAALDLSAPSARFFTKLRNLVGLLETERANLEHAASQNLNEDEREDRAAGTVRTLHDIHSEVRGLKKQIQSQVASQEGGSEELRSFIKSCMVLKQRTTEDIERIKKHFEKYGYKPQKAPQNSSEEYDKAVAEPREELAEDAEEGIQMPISVQEPETPERLPPPAVDQMRTPQLSDFGLSAMQLQMLLGNAQLSQQEAPVLSVALSPPPPPPLVMNMQPVQPKTPRCSLNMDEDMPTPRLEDFGITEHTVCLNNDFTMDLFRKKPPKDRQGHRNTKEISQKPLQNLSTSPPCVRQGMFSNESMESPEVPEFYTVKLNMNKLPATSMNMTESVSAPHSPPCTNKGPATPELPTFETPYISKLISARKETRLHERNELKGCLNNISSPLECPADNGSPSFAISQMPVSVFQQEETTPEMPSLESYFCVSLTGNIGKRSGLTQRTVPVQPTDEDHTQDYCLTTPQVRMDFQEEPRTPEMPDMSSVTQDILKLVSQTKSKPSTTTSIQQSSKPGMQMLAPGKENSAQTVASVSENEFHGLGSYMKQIPLTSLNQAIDKINHVIEERCRDGDSNLERFNMEDLRKILEVGPQTPMYILSLVELKRIENVQGVGRNATFKIVTKV